jgi:hypothetical protein
MEAALTHSRMLTTRRRKQKNRKVLARTAKFEKKMARPTADIPVANAERKDGDADQKTGD